MPRRTARERGTATVEAALVLPVLVLFGVTMAWLVDLGVTHARAVDAARETARSAARGEPVSQAVALGQRVAVPGSAIDVHADDARVRVQVVSRVRGPGGVLGRLGPAVVRATAVAATEPTGDSGALGGPP